MQFIPASQILASMPKKPKCESGRPRRSYDAIYNTCVDAINTQIQEQASKGYKELEFSFWESLGDEYNDHYRLHQNIFSDLDKAGYNVNYPIWSDSAEADG